MSIISFIYIYIYIYYMYLFSSSMIENNLEKELMACALADNM
jgi:hypothetical protein